MNQRLNGLINGTTMQSKLVEAHFCGLPSQSNMYGLASLSTREGTNKILVASLKRKVFCVEYSKNFIPSTPEVQFTYIPGGAEIISIDAFNRSPHGHDFVVGITFIKKNDTTSSHYFNIYSGWEPDSEFDLDLDNIAQGCLSIELEFTPTQLYHAQILTDEGKEVVWLLSGSDCVIHLYREDKTQHYFREEPSADFFPEFQELPSIVLWMDILYSSNNIRLTAVGCEDGYVRLSSVHIGSDGPSVLSTWEVEHDGPIASVRLFRDRNIVDVPAPLQNVFQDQEGIPEKEEFHLLVCNTIEASVVFRNVLENGLKIMWILADSNRLDCSTTACVADVDMDGYNELLIGTYGQELLVYKLDEQTKGYNLLWERAFSHPLLSIAYVDITGDGLKELLVLSTKGLHILQHNLQEVVELCLTRIKKLVELLQIT